MFFDLIDCAACWNYGGILGATIFASVLGALWYSPKLFAHAWALGHGTTLEDMSEDEDVQKHGMAAIYLAWIGYGTMAYVVHFLVTELNYNDVEDGLWLGLVLFCGFSIPLTMIQNAFNPRGNKLLVLIDCSYHLVFFLFQASFIAYCVGRAKQASASNDAASQTGSETAADDVKREV